MIAETTPVATKVIRKAERSAPLIAGQAAKKPGQHSTQRQPARRKCQSLETGPQFQQREGDNQDADDRLDDRNLKARFIQRITR